MFATLDSSNNHFQGPNNSIRLLMQPTKIANLLIYSSLSLLVCEHIHHIRHLS